MQATTFSVQFFRTGIVFVVPKDCTDRGFLHMSGLTVVDEEEGIGEEEEEDDQRQVYCNRQQPSALIRNRK